jgi:hypothetical protein
MPLIDIPKDARKGKPPCGECHLPQGETCDICGAHELTAAQQAYGLLWRDMTASPLVHRARKLLLETLTKAEQREAIEWVTREIGPTTTAEVVKLDF